MLKNQWKELKKLNDRQKSQIDFNHKVINSHEKNKKAKKNQKTELREIKKNIQSMLNPQFTLNQ